MTTLNGQLRPVFVRDRSIKVETRQAEKADTSKPGQVAAPFSGVVTLKVERRRHRDGRPAGRVDRGDEDGGGDHRRPSTASSSGSRSARPSRWRPATFWSSSVPHSSLEVGIRPHNDSVFGDTAVTPDRSTRRTTTPQRRRALRHRKHRDDRPRHPRRRRRGQRRASRRPRRDACRRALDRSDVDLATGAEVARRVPEDEVGGRRSTTSPVECRGDVASSRDERVDARSRRGRRRRAARRRARRDADEPPTTASTAAARSRARPDASTERAASALARSSGSFRAPTSTLPRSASASSRQAARPPTCSPPTACSTRNQVVRPEPEGAWQHFVYSISGHRINLGDGKRARARKELDRRIAAPLERRRPLRAGALAQGRRRQDDRHDAARHGAGRRARRPHHRRRRQPRPRHARRAHRPRERQDRARPREGALRGHRLQRLLEHRRARRDPPGRARLRHRPARVRGVQRPRLPRRREPRRALLLDRAHRHRHRHRALGDGRHPRPRRLSSSSSRASASTRRASPPRRSPGSRPTATPSRCATRSSCSTTRGPAPRSCSSTSSRRTSARACATSCAIPYDPHIAAGSAIVVPRPAARDPARGARPRGLGRRGPARPAPRAA